ncbi:maltokinase N-terminal cap-like domain-containing protein [Microbacterium sp.]|uniref:maltokinase N-terminal cap-like domain-containing protein n=1 Tax=Microbacterium sp. TaxID=51671 RepID=UPI0039E30907
MGDLRRRLLSFSEITSVDADTRELVALVQEWIPAQRWFASKGTAPRLRLLAAATLPPEVPETRVHVLIIRDEATATGVTYHVPVVDAERSTPATYAGIIGHRGNGNILVDGPRHPAYTAALAHAVAPQVEAADGRVLDGEQSNTSIIYRGEGQPVICKIYRQLHVGSHPDIDLQSALARSGCRRVPAAVGVWEGAWSPTASGALAFAQEYFPDVQDAWRVARSAALAGRSFLDDARTLGEATADVHLRLAELFPTPPSDAIARRAIATAWDRRLRLAVSEVPAIQRHRAAIAEVYAAALETTWPPLQRIHGDYHLGQVLQVPGRGWVLLDFEGEPLRPMTERLRPDAALRDIAGMLRSFDYVAGSLQNEGDPERLREWAAAARSGFVRGYERRTQHPSTGALLDAFELDKAVYEAIYEARNRPSWLEIPLTAIDRLVDTD